jgi:hypothetical protein
MTKKLRVVLLIICVVSGLLADCQRATSVTPEPIIDIGDGGFLSMEPCGPPCFLNITPGITSQKQTFEILQTWVDLQNCIIDDETEDGSVGWIRCGNVSVTFDNSERVENIGYILLEPILVGDVIAKYGNPDSVYVWIYRPGDSYSEKKTIVSMVLLYDSIKTMIALPDQEGEAYYDVEPDTRISKISYLVGNSWETWGPLNPDSQLWVGYGNYNGEFVEPYP